MGLIFIILLLKFHLNKVGPDVEGVNGRIKKSS